LSQLRLDSKRFLFFFAMQAPATCKPDERREKPREDGDNDGDADIQPGAGTGSGSLAPSACQLAGAAQGGGSGAGSSAGKQQANMQLATVARLLREIPHSHGLEASLQRSDPALKNRRQLFTAVARAKSCNQGVAGIVGQIIQRFGCYVTASYVSEEDRDLGPRLRAFVKEKIVPCLLEVEISDVMLRIIFEALSAPDPSSQRDVSLTSSSREMRAACENLPQLPGVPGLLQRLEACCLCGAAPRHRCKQGHLSFCHECTHYRGLKYAGGKCLCLAIAVSLQPTLREVCEPGAKRCQALLLKDNFLFRAGRLLVLAATLDLDSVRETLLKGVVQVVTCQLLERLRPALTAEQLVVLRSKHHNVTDHLVDRVAKAHADLLREHMSFSPGSTQVTPSSPRLGGPRLGYLAGTLVNAEVARGAMSNGHDTTEPDTWLIICAERSTAPSANVLVDHFSRKKRLLVLKGDPADQAAKVRALNLDLLVLTAFPTEEMEYILASCPANKTVNWRGLSGSRTDLCDFTLIGSSSPGADSRQPDPRVIRVGFDQPVQATSFFPDGSAKQSPTREMCGLPAVSCFVVMFPGFLEQVDKFSLWTWMQLVAGLDRSVLALPAGHASMKVYVEGWVEEYANRHGPFATDRVLLLEWQGSEIHAARIGFSNLCVATLDPMSLTCFAAPVLAEAVGFLVLEGTASADVGLCGLGALLIASNAEDFVRKGQEWASQWKSANAFLREQRAERAGYFNRDRVSNSLSNVFREVLSGQETIVLDETIVLPVPVYIDDKKIRRVGILKTIGEQRLGKAMFYKQGFERILDFLEHEGIKVTSVAGIGGSAYVLRANLSRGPHREMQNVVVKIDRFWRRDSKLHNSSVLRDAKHGRIMAQRMRGSKSFSHLVPNPVLVLNGGTSFVGYTEPNSSQHVILFSIFQDVEGRFEDTLAGHATKWFEDATFSNDLVLCFQEIFLALWHAHRNGLIISDIKAENIGQTPHGKAVFWDLGHSACGPPKAGDAYGKPSGAIALSRRNTSHHFAAGDHEHGTNQEHGTEGTNPLGDANLYRASGQGKRKIPFLFLTASDLDRGDQRSRQKGRGLGRLGPGTFPNYDCVAAEERAEAVKKNPNAPADREREEAGDVFQAVRTILQVFNRVDWKNPEEWERRASAAAADPEHMLEFLKRGTLGTPQQPLALKRFADLFALALGPGPRPKLIDLMTHLAFTSPALPPEVEQAVLGEGFDFQGGTLGELHRGIKAEWRELVIPPTHLLLERVEPKPDGEDLGSALGEGHLGGSTSRKTGEHLGAGLQAGGSLKAGELAAFYCGTKRAHSDGVGAMDTFPSRYGVSVRSAQQKEKFSIDGFAGRKLTLQWLIDHQATGAFMNAGDWQGGPASNVRLDRHKAWTDPATGIVWIPMYAIYDIAAGDFLRWKYNPVDGEGGIYNFKCSLQIA
jgi:hypothetical protein